MYFFSFFINYLINHIGKATSSIMPNNKTKMNDIIFAILNVHNFVLKPEQINPIKEKNAINIGSKSKNSIPLADESFDKRSISLNILTEAAITPYKAYKDQAPVLSRISRLRRLQGLLACHSAIPKYHLRSPFRKQQARGTTTDQFRIL